MSKSIKTVTDKYTKTAAKKYKPSFTIVVDGRLISQKDREWFFFTTSLSAAARWPTKAKAQEYLDRKTALFGPGGAKDNMRPDTDFSKAYVAEFILKKAK